jgi:beta-galactosidase
MRTTRPAHASGLVGLLLLAMAGSPARALTVRVDPAGGAPRLVVNGVPVRARIFWGAPGSSPVPIAPEWKDVRFEFTASSDARAGTMHFRFGSVPGEVTLDDVHVVDLDGPSDLIPRCDFENGLASFQRDWTVWPTDATNTVGTVAVVPGAGRDGSAALRVKLVAPPDGNWPDFHIYHLPRLAIRKGHRYRVSFWAKSVPARDLTVAFYLPGQQYVHLGGPPDRFGSQIKLAAGVGVDLVSFPIDMPWPPRNEAADWSAVDTQCEQVLAANPRALLLPRMGMDPPPWWREAHPDDVMRWEDGRRDAGVVASPTYRHDAAERLAALIAHLEQRFGESVAGYHPCGQNTGEWFYQDTWLRPLNGYAPADRAAWRAWLKTTYRDDAGLRRAWNDRSASLATAAVPTPAARHAAPHGILRDPVAERPLIDWGEFQQQAMADCVRTLAHAARTASRGRKLVVFFYGYVFEFGAIQNDPATAGHYALRRVLDCPDIDVLCSPISYIDRGLGQSAPAMSATESVVLAGKMWINEDDTHTYLATGTPPGSMDHVTTLEETNRELTRNVAQEALRNFGTWWMDLGSSGWFDDPGMWSVMKSLSALDEPLLKTPTPFRPEVAAVIDERSMLRVASGGVQVTRPGVYEARIPLGRMGAPYGQYLMDDVAAGRVHAKMYVLLDAWCLDPPQRAALLRGTAGSTRVWCYAPGYQEDRRESPEAMRQLTGFRLRPVDSGRALATPTAAGKRLGLRQPLGVDQPVRPLLAASDASGDEVLATYRDGSAAVALRHAPGGTSLFVGTPGLSSELLRLAARASGVHLFTETDCNVYASGPFVALHASQDGPLVLDVGRIATVHDVLSGAAVGTGPRLTLSLKRGDTRVLRFGPNP